MKKLRPKSGVVPGIVDRTPQCLSLGCNPEKDILGTIQRSPEFLALIDAKAESCSLDVACDKSGVAGVCVGEAVLRFYGSENDGSKSTIATASKIGSSFVLRLVEENISFGLDDQHTSGEDAPCEEPKAPPIKVVCGTKNLSVDCSGCNTPEDNIEKVNAVLDSGSANNECDVVVANVRCRGMLFDESKSCYFCPARALLVAKGSNGNRVTETVAIGDGRTGIKPLVLSQSLQDLLQQ